jgi:hypothetical protein
MKLPRRPRRPRRIIAPIGKKLKQSTKLLLRLRGTDGTIGKILPQQPAAAGEAEHHNTRGTIHGNQEGSEWGNESQGQETSGQETSGQETSGQEGQVVDNPFSKTKPARMSRLFLCAAPHFSSSRTSASVESFCVCALSRCTSLQRELARQASD